MAATGVINTRQMKYSGGAITALKNGNLAPDVDLSTSCSNISNHQAFSNRAWSEKQNEMHSPLIEDGVRHSIGQYPLTSELAPWVAEALLKYKPTDEVLNLVQPYAAEFHEHLEKERANSTGLHNLDLVELTYQVSLEVGAALLIAAREHEDAVGLEVEFHSSRAARDSHFAPWGQLLIGLECDPPIISQFPFYLMMCQAFGLETSGSREDYVYSALTAVDWAKGQNVFSDRLEAFEKKARAAVPKLNDKLSGKDRSFWRIALAYLAAMNKCENAQKFTTPKTASINHDLDINLIMAIRSFDTIGSAYMCGDGAAFLDNAGMDALLGSALPNDVMDLHTDIKTGETRNLLRLLYPNGPNIKESIQIMSTVLSGMLCEIFRAHKRARFENREDGRISATSPPYSFCRARHRRIFETLETYIHHYPSFWDWTDEIYNGAKAQITEAGLNELLVNALRRARAYNSLPDSDANNFYDIYFDMIENGKGQMNKKRPLDVHENIAWIVREIHSLWHDHLHDPGKKPGWGREFDEKSDSLLGEAGKILGEKGEISDEVYRFAIAYGRLSMALPYIAYHTVDAIIMTFGIAE